MAGYINIGRKETDDRLYIHREKGNRSQSKGTCQDMQIKGETKWLQSKGVWQVIYTGRKQIGHRIGVCGSLYRHWEKGNTSQIMGISYQNLGC
jgi:hypothetical protein